MTHTIKEGVVQAIGSPDLQDSAAELAEIGLDQFLDDGALREVPILGTVVRPFALWERFVTLSSLRSFCVSFWSSEESP